MVFKRLQNHQTDRNAEHQHHKRWSGIIGTGQSLSNGCMAPLDKETEPAPLAYKLVDSSGEYDCQHPGAPSLTVVPLTEPFRWKQNHDMYPANILGKTPHSSMAWQIAHMSASRKMSPTQTFHTAVGIGGSPFSDICKGGNKNSYEASLFEAKALTRIAKETGNEIAYDCILMTHGEADALLGNREYGETLMAFLENYAHDLRKITGQHHKPTMILSQQHTSPMDRVYPSPVINQQWKVQLWSDNAIVCSSPKYQFKYPDGLHLTAQGYNRLGEKYGQVYHQHLIENKPWIPLRPQKIVLVDNSTIQVDFSVPTPPLNWDSCLPPPHTQTDGFKCWNKARGFEVRGVRGKPLEISNVKIDKNGTSVIINLATPTLAHQYPLSVGYAMTQSGNGFLGGKSNGRMGHLRDSDAIEASNNQVLRCKVKPGSNEIFCPDKGFMRRAAYDNVIAGNESYTIMDIPPERTKAFLSKPWAGKEGWCDIKFSTEMRNYCVSFAENTGWDEESEKAKGSSMWKKVLQNLS